MQNWIGKKLDKEGKSVIISTSNPASIMSLKKSPLWIATNFGRHSRVGSTGIKGMNHCASRITASFKYKGDYNFSRRNTAVCRKKMAGCRKKNLTELNNSAAELNNNAVELNNKKR